MRLFVYGKQGRFRGTNTADLKRNIELKHFMKDAHPYWREIMPDNAVIL